jgi:hypothetical protein
MADLLGTNDASRVLGLGENAIYHLAARGEIAVDGWPIKVRRAEIEVYIARSKLQPGQLGRTLNQYRKP